MSLQGDEGADREILEALIERTEDGMTLFEIRNQVEADIDAIEASLERLKARDLIETDVSEDRVTIRPAPGATGAIEVGDDGGSVLERIRERLPF